MKVPKPPISGFSIVLAACGFLMVVIGLTLAATDVVLVGGILTVGVAQLVSESAKASHYGKVCAERLMSFSSDSEPVRRRREVQD